MPCLMQKNRIGLIIASYVVLTLLIIATLFYHQDRCKRCNTEEDKRLRNTIVHDFVADNQSMRECAHILAETTNEPVFFEQSKEDYKRMAADKDVRITLREKRTELTTLLDVLTSRNKLYDWSIENGVIYIFPKASGERGKYDNTIFNNIIERYEIEDDDILEAVQKLNALGENSKKWGLFCFMECKRRGRINMKESIYLKAKGITTREIIQKLIRIDGNVYVSVSYHGDNTPSVNIDPRIGTYFICPLPNSYECYR